MTAYEDHTPLRHGDTKTPPARRRVAGAGRSIGSGLLALGLCAACGHVDYAGAEVGRFSGSLFVMWVGEGGASGDGKFVFVPSPNAPLSFETVDAQGRRQVIRPEAMYTDGGSIPRIGQVFNGFAPWGYAPAYMIHDWLFAARHCLRDGIPTAAERRMAGISFEDSAQILASAIKTLVDAGRVKPNDVAATAISAAVAGPVARSLWDETGACRVPRLDEQDRLAVEAAIPGASQGLQRRRGIPPSTIVGEFTF